MAAAVWIAGESMRLTTAPTDAPVEVAQPPHVIEPPPSVIFSAPLADETDFPVSGPRPDPVLARHERRRRSRATCASATPAPNAPPTAAAGVNRHLQRRNRSLEIRFKEPLERFQTVTIDLLEGIAAIDGQPLSRGR